MKRRCLTCHKIILAGSRCKPCQEAYRPAAARTVLPLQAKQRDNFACKHCGSVTNLRVHHIVPLELKGTNDLANLITLCDTCHQKIHSGEVQ